MKRVSLSFLLVAAFMMILALPAFADSGYTKGKTQSMRGTAGSTATDNSGTGMNGAGTGMMDRDFDDRDGYNMNNRVTTDGNYRNYSNNGATNTANRYRTYANNGNNMSWGWLGLLGLIGLAGMRGRDREKH
ncbi:hypothetical protein EBB07_27720 [Paenibacillaceae bacterium]|nr:hypothetical protein EBB07_27720 [Paenibacillaceae bacterium]